MFYHFPEHWTEIFVHNENKFPADTGFLGSKNSVTAAVLRDRVKYVLQFPQDSVLAIAGPVSLGSCSGCQY
jgi:hypothetical protein